MTRKAPSVRSPLGERELPSTAPTARGTSFARTDSSVSCVLTRFRLRSIWAMAPFYLRFRSVQREARQVSGLIKALFLIEDLRTCYTLSLWRDDAAILSFNSCVPSHIHAANFALGAT